MKTALTLLVLLVFFSSAYSQTARFDWVKRIGDSGNDCPGIIANDSLGNLYVAGAFVGQLIFGTDTLNSTSASNASIYLVKYDGAGNVLWAKKQPMTNTNIGACSLITLNRIRVSPRGRIYLVGFLNYNGTTKEYLTINRSNGSLVGYADQASDHNNVDIDIDSADNSYMTGVIAATHYFIIKFDSSGNPKWSYITSPENRPLNIKYANGYVYVAGQFHYQLQLSDTLGSPSITVNASAGINDWDFFIAKYSKNGQLISAVRNDGPVSNAAGPFTVFGDFTPSNKWRIGEVNTGLKGYTKAYSSSTLAVVDSTTVVQVNCPFQPWGYLKVGRLQDKLVFSYDGLVCSPKTAYVLDSTGVTTQILYVPYAGPSNSVAQRDYSFDKQSNLFVCSNFQGTINYNDSLGSHSLSSNSGSEDLYVAKFHSCPKYNPVVAQFGDTLSTSVPGLQYQWYLNNTPIPSGTHQYLLPSQNGNYRVVVSDSWTCTDTSAVFTFTLPASVANIESNSPITIQPNPATTEIIITGLPIGSLLQISDLSGKMLLKTVSTSGTTTIDVSNFYKGMYFIHTPIGQAKFVRM